MIRILFYTWLLCCWAGRLFGQTDTIPLPLVEVKGASLRHSEIGSRTERLALDRAASNLADVLQQTSGVFVKNYGLGSLATTSVRGGSAGHTAVVWNGFVIASPMLGQLDFSLLPSFLVDEANFQLGGNSAGWGSGSIGGTVFLDNKAEFGQAFRVVSQSILGSFSWRQQQLQIGYSGKKIAVKTKLFFQEAENDFPYRLRPDLPERRQTNFALYQRGGLQEVYWKYKPGQQLALHVWLQESEREIPPLTTQSQSMASQGDEVLRTSIHWRKTGKKTVWQARSGFFAEKIDYRDELIRLRAKSDFQTFINEVEQQ